jgi:hypothetical protein
VTPLRISILAAVACVILLLIVFELIRRGRLREKYAILWLATGVVLLTLALWRDGLDTIAGWAGVSYPPAILFAVGALFVLAVLLHYSTVISKLADQNTRLAQKVAILEERLAQVNGRPLEDRRPEKPVARRE